MPPPHLSPFVNNEDEGYTPDFATTIKKLQDAAKAARQRAAGILPEGGFLGEQDNEQLAAPEMEDMETAEQVRRLSVVLGGLVWCYHDPLLFNSSSD